jgi:RecB family exonuclease
VTTWAPATTSSAWLTAVSHAVTAAKGGEPLAPVTLVAPSSYAARCTGRLLAGRHGPGSTGAVNVRCTTVDRLMAELGGAELARLGLRLAGPVVEAELLRSTAGEAGDPWAAVAQQGATLRALQRAHAELRRLGEAAVDVLAARPGRAGDTARLLVRVRGRMRERALADALDLGEAALAAARRDHGTAGLGAVVVVDRPALSPVEAEFLAVLERRPGSTRVEYEPATSCTEVRPCADPDEEGRAAARSVLQGLEDGVPLWRQAVLHPRGTAYARLVHHELSALHIPTWGPATRTLAATAAGRGLLGLLDLAGGDLPRASVLGWLRSVPATVGADGTAVPVGRWQTLSASAGVVRGLDQWRDRLARLTARNEDRREDADALTAFVEELARRLDRPAGPWSAWAGWATGLLDRYLPSDASWPEEQRLARAEVAEVVRALGELDTVSSAPDVGRFISALRHQLEDRPAPTGPAGEGESGVLVAPFDVALGLRLHAVVLLGLADGIVPASPQDDPLLPEATRAVDERLLDDVTAALGAGEARRVVTYPRCDPRTGQVHEPSRFLPGLCDERTVMRPVESFAASLRLGGPALDRVELTTRTLDTVWRRTGDVTLAAPVSAEPALARGIEVVRARAGRGFTRYDGRLGPGEVTPVDAEHPVSATRLEIYAECPRRFLFERVLGIRSRLLPEDLWRIDARDRGSLVHRILEDYVRARLEGADRSLALLLGIAERRLDQAEAEGMVGRGLPWRLDRAAIVRDLHTFYAEEGDAEPLAAEFSFGAGDEEDAPALVLALPDGRTVRFHGRADRVDRAADGGLVVSDYKTGRQTALARLTADPLVGGRRLQLPVYGAAARERFGATGPVRARYWMVSAERSTAYYHLELTPEVEAHFRDIVGRIAHGIEGGAFPGVPGPPRADGFEHCLFCDFDRVCPANRDRHWALKRADPALAPVSELVESEVPESVAGAVVRGPGDGEAR